MTKENIKSTEQWLDETFFIIDMLGNRPVDNAYYYGALAAIQFLGMDWERDENGKHKIYK